MSQYIASPEAEEDVFQIWAYLLRWAGATVANRIEGEILEAFAHLAAIPSQGHRRPDLTDTDVLFYTLYEFMIV